MVSIAFDKAAFMNYLMAKCNFSGKGAEWACIWVEKFLRFYPDWSENRERAIAGFSEALSSRKPINIVNLALRSVRLFIAFVDFDLGERGQVQSNRAGEVATSSGTINPTVASLQLSAPKLPDSAKPNPAALSSKGVSPEALSSGRANQVTSPREEASKAHGAVSKMADSKVITPKVTRLKEPGANSSDTQGAKACSISASSDGNSGESGDREWQEWASQVMKQVRELIRLKHRSLRTEKTYLGWTRRFLDFIRVRRLANFVDGAPKITSNHLRSYLSYLAVEVGVNASTQEQALNALLVLFRMVLHIEIEGLSSVLRAKKRKRLPVVLSRDEVSALLVQLR
jgi:hypothetical protein